MIVNGVAISVNGSATPVLTRMLDFDVEYKLGTMQTKALRKLRTRTKLMQNSAFLTKAEGTYELSYSLLQEIFKLICPLYDETNQVYYPDDSHDLSNYTIKYYYTTLEDGTIYQTNSGVIEKAVIDFPVNAIPSVKVTSYHKDKPASTSVEFPTSIDDFLNPRHLVVGVATYTGDSLGTFTQLETNSVQIEFAQSIDPKIGKSGTIDKFIAKDFDLSLKIDAVYNNTMHDAFVNSKDISIQIQYVVSDTVLFTILFPQLTFKQYLTLGKYKLISAELIPNAFDYYPIQISY